MTNHNRKDELAQHCEFLSKNQIIKLPETFDRQIARAKNMCFFGDTRLRALRLRNPYADLALHDEAMEHLYQEIQGDGFVQQREWKPLYVRYIMEYDWLRELLLQDHWSQADLIMFSNKRASVLKLMEAIEKANNIRAKATPSQRWSLDNQLHNEHHQNARNLWLDELTGAIRASVTKELHWRGMLNDHGHSKITRLNFCTSTYTPLKLVKTLQGGWRD